MLRPTTPPYTNSTCCGSAQTTTAFAQLQTAQLTSIDTNTGTARSLASLPALVSAQRVSMAVLENHHLVLAVQKDAQTTQLYELDPVPTRPSWVGYATLPGRLQDDIFIPDDLRVPIANQAGPVIQTVTSETLGQMTGSGSAGDQDNDGVPDVLDDCPAGFNPSQGGCPDQTQALLYASSKLTLADRVTTLGASQLVVSAGTALTQVGVDARIGNLFSRGPVELRDRARANSIASGGSVTLGNGAGAVNGIQSNIQLALNALSFSVTFPPAGPPITLEPDRRQDVAPDRTAQYPSSREVHSHCPRATSTSSR